MRKRGNILLTTLFHLLCLTLVSCVSLHQRDRAVETIKGSAQWRTWSFSNTCVTIEAPMDARVYEVFDGEVWIVSVGHHYISAPPGVLDDATVHVQIKIERLLASSLASRFADTKQSNLYKRLNSDARQMYEWTFTIHEITSVWDNEMSYTYFRRDLILNEREILHASAEVLTVGSMEGQIADKATAKRILDSMTMF